MAVKDYREMYVGTILTLIRETNNNNITREYLSTLSFDELKTLAEKLQA